MIKNLGENPKCGKNHQILCFLITPFANVKSQSSCILQSIRCKILSVLIFNIVNTTFFFFTMQDDELFSD
ncbi:hypothetical protein NKOR_02920 [Candidatus Nitrosopumilus koreensis AR1]|uniref:Uncharacterized protein n=1 Tax=Candidatus Nitrosopumilus koreensis AR1 TaxID=1229908 RepID=K0B357_9ARCH|nr:hypothetical protein NKOR_02920 [Candidatus Nitrosopumilus koreensis AR1]